MTGLVIATPSVADAPALSAMAQRSFVETFAFRDYPSADLAHFLETMMGVERYAQQITDPDFALKIVKNAAGDVIGFIKMGPNDLPLPQGEPPVEQTRELHQLYLLSEAKGSGIAAALMQWGLDWARAEAAQALYLSVYVDNHRARRFYARHGFVEIGHYPFPIGSVIDDDRIWKLAL